MHRNHFLQPDITGLTVCSSSELRDCHQDEH